MPKIIAKTLRFGQENALNFAFCVPPAFGNFSRGGIGNHRVETLKFFFLDNLQQWPLVSALITRYVVYATSTKLEAIFALIMVLSTHFIHFHKKNMCVLNKNSQQSFVFWNETSCEKSLYNEKLVIFQSYPRSLG